MNGRWRVRERGGPPWRGAPWLVLRTREWEATQWNGPVLSLGDAQARTLGPDLLAPETEVHDVLARLRRAEQLRLVGDALVSGANSPGGDGRVLALARTRGTMLYTPGRGWSRAFTPLVEIGPTPIALVWPRPNLMIAGGAVGYLASTNYGPFSLDQDFDDTRMPDLRIDTFDGLKRQNTVLALACTASDPVDCVAVGLGMLGHGLTTPGVLGRAMNPWVIRLPYLAMTSFAVSLAVAGRPPTSRVHKLVGRAPVAAVALPTVAIAALVGAVVVRPSLLGAVQPLTNSHPMATMVTTQRTKRTTQMGRDFIRDDVCPALAMRSPSSLRSL